MYALNESASASGGQSKRANWPDPLPGVVPPWILLRFPDPLEFGPLDANTWRPLIMHKSAPPLRKIEIIKFARMGVSGVTSYGALGYVPLRLCQCTDN